MLFLRGNRSAWRSAQWVGVEGLAGVVSSIRAPEMCIELKQEGRHPSTPLVRVLAALSAGSWTALALHLLNFVSLQVVRDISILIG